MENTARRVVQLPTVPGSEIATIAAAHPDHPVSGDLLLGSRRLKRPPPPEAALSRLTEHLLMPPDYLVTSFALL